MKGTQRRIFLVGHAPRQFIKFLSGKMRQPFEVMVPDGLSGATIS
jgi:hypothetical protein